MIQVKNSNFLIIIIFPSASAVTIFHFLVTMAASTLATVTFLTFNTATIMLPLPCSQFVECDINDFGAFASNQICDSLFDAIKSKSDEQVKSVVAIAGVVMTSFISLKMPFLTHYTLISIPTLVQ